MARRRRQEPEQENHERWLVSYADFITLLFAFFVVMYAVSSVNEGKYRVLSETLNAVFATTPRSDQPIQVGEPSRDLIGLPDGRPMSRPGSGAEGDADGIPLSDEGSDVDASGPQVSAERFAKDGGDIRLADQLTLGLQGHIDDGLIRINQSGGRVEIEMKERMLFGSGDARLAPQALSVLREIAQTLARIPSHLQVEGHTDNVPIATAAYPSNWELSAARAASVVHYLARIGIEPWRMSAVGLGEHRPLAENTDERGRAANRRVTIVVLSGQRVHQAPLDHDVPWAEGPGLSRP